MKNIALSLCFSISLITGLTSCEEASNSCYDEEMEKNHSGICTKDCPGVTGCDGKFYCNECEANSVGIEVE